MNALKNLFTPIGKEYCDWFYYLSVLFFLMFVVSLVVVLILIFDKKPLTGVEVFVLLTQPLILYFVNRLYYSMCISSLSK